MTFWYLMVPMDTDDFIIWLLFALNFDQILKNRKNTLQKSIILTFHTDFSLISTGFVNWGYNFIWSITVPLPFSRVLLTNIRKYLKNYFWRHQLELSPFERDFGPDLPRSKKGNFKTTFRGWSIKYEKKAMELWYFK